MLPLIMKSIGPAKEVWDMVKLQNEIQIVLVENIIKLVDRMKGKWLKQNLHNDNNMFRLWLW